MFFVAALFSLVCTVFHNKLKYHYTTQIYYSICFSICVNWTPRSDGFVRWSWWVFAQCMTKNYLIRNYYIIIWFCKQNVVFKSYFDHIALFEMVINLFFFRRVMIFEELMPHIVSILTIFNQIRILYSASYAEDHRAQQIRISHDHYTALFRSSI